MERPSVIIGIHGLANKPPVAEKTRWWSAAGVSKVVTRQITNDTVQLRLGTLRASMSEQAPSTA